MMSAFYLLFILAMTSLAIAVVLAVLLVGWWLVDTRRERREEEEEKTCHRCRRTHAGPEDCELWTTR